MSHRVRKDQRFCDHASGVITFDTEEGMLCDDCGAPLVIVSRLYLDKLVSDLRDCRRGITRWAGE